MTHKVWTAMMLAGSLACLTACGAPLKDVPKLADVDLAKDAPNTELATTASAEEPIFRPGLFAGLFGGARSNPESPISTPAKDPATANGSDAESTTSQGQGGTATPQAVPKKRQGGLFGGGRKASSSEPDVTAGAPLAFGQVGRVCGVRGKALGRKVETFPKSGGRKAYKLYDSAPGSTQARAFYITGFSDGCARQVTAANVVFGAPSMYELLRYGRPAAQVLSSKTDAAYKKLKMRICRVARNAPCGGAISKIEADTVFVTMYGKFTGNQRGANLLLHKGAVLAADVETKS